MSDFDASDFLKPRHDRPDLLEQMKRRGRIQKTSDRFYSNAERLNIAWALLHGFDPPFPWDGETLVEHDAYWYLLQQIPARKNHPLRGWTIQQLVTKFNKLFPLDPGER